MVRSHAPGLSTGQTVSALLHKAHNASACLVLAHGAGAGMTHRFMNSAAGGLADRGVSMLRYQFPYMEAGSKRVDRPEIAHSAVRAAVAAVVSPLPLVEAAEDMTLLPAGSAWTTEPATLATSPATVVCVQTRPSLGVGTPRSVRARASPTMVDTPSPRSRSISNQSRCAA